MEKGLIARFVNFLSTRKKYKELIAKYRVLSYSNDVTTKALASTRVELNQTQIDFELLKIGYNALKKELNEIKGTLMKGTSPRMEVFA